MLLDDPVSRYDLNCTVLVCPPLATGSGPGGQQVCHRRPDGDPTRIQPGRPKRRPKQNLHTQVLSESSPVNIKFANCGLACVLKPAGRLQISDILAQKAVPEGARRDIELWTG